VGTLADFLNAPLAWLQQGLYQGVFQPLLYAAGWMQFDEIAFDATEWLLIGALEVVLLWLVLGAFERRWPAQSVSTMDPERRRQRRAAIRTDVIYTLLHRLGGFALLAFLLLQPAMDAIDGQLRLWGISPWQLDSLWPGVSDIAWVSVLLYLVVLDAADYAIHRAQHRFGWWWALHGLHHSQQDMTFWSDQRNHLLDDLIRDALLAVLALAIGVAPEQYVLLVVLTRVAQSAQHANWATDFGVLGRWLIVSPAFHRLHHAIGVGHEGPRQGCNFGVIFPWWDRLFGSADFSYPAGETGIRDQLAGRDYGRGFWSQQWLGIARMFGRG
jgi:sterol desaturase/sphingolipid hydroxylase (fatty acid hydroxylase superfamily)